MAVALAEAVGVGGADEAAAADGVVGVGVCEAGVGDGVVSMPLLRSLRERLLLGDGVEVGEVVVGEVGEPLCGGDDGVLREGSAIVFVCMGEREMRRLRD